MRWWCGKAASGRWASKRPASTESGLRQSADAVQRRQFGTACLTTRTCFIPSGREAAQFGTLSPLLRLATTAARPCPRDYPPKNPPSLSPSLFFRYSAGSARDPPPHRPPGSASPTRVGLTTSSPTPPLLPLPRPCSPSTRPPRPDHLGPESPSQIRLHRQLGERQRLLSRPPAVRWSLRGRGGGRGGGRGVGSCDEVGEREADKVGSGLIEYT